MFYLVFNMNKSEQPNIISYDNSYSNYKNKDKIKKNIYYIILDGMNSIERMTYENISLQNNLKTLKKI